MRRLGAALAAAALLLAPGIPDAQGPAPPGAQAPTDVPSGPAVLAGRVVHRARPEAAAGVEVVLYALSADGRPGSRRARTDEAGRFRFEGLSNAAGVVYLVGVRFAGLPFPGERVAFGGEVTAGEVEIAISDPTRDVATVRVARSGLSLEWSGRGIVVREVHEIANEGDRVIHVPPGERASATAPFRTRLLPDATGFAMPMGLVPEGIERNGAELRFWGPLYPGPQEISFRYEIPAPPGPHTLAKVFPAGAGRVEVQAAEGGALAGVEGLEREPPAEGAPPGWLVYAGRDAPPGFEATLHLRVPEMREDPGALEVADARLILEVDDVALSAREEYALRVAPGGALVAPPGETLLTIPVPEGAFDVRFSADAMSMGLGRLPDGSVGVQGPLRPGSHAVGLAWRLRTEDGQVRFTRGVDRHLALLRAFVADTGVAVSTDRLHRRRPVRDADRTYLVYEGFELEAGETVTFSVRTLPPRGGARGPARVAAVALGLAVVAFLLAPLQRGGDAGSGEAAQGDAQDEGRAGEAERRAAAVAREREALYESIRDLDHDHETGKVSETDWSAMRAELRARAVALLREEREAQAAGPGRGSGEPPPDHGAAPDGAGCDACGAGIRPGDRFCARCGERLGPSAA